MSMNCETKVMTIEEDLTSIENYCGSIMKTVQQIRTKHQIYLARRASRNVLNSLLVLFPKL